MANTKAIEDREAKETPGQARRAVIRVKARDILTDDDFDTIEQKGVEDVSGFGVIDWYYTDKDSDGDSGRVIEMIVEGDTLSLAHFQTGIEDISENIENLFDCVVSYNLKGKGEI